MSDMIRRSQQYRQGPRKILENIHAAAPSSPCFAPRSQAPPGNDMTSRLRLAKQAEPGTDEDRPPVSSAYAAFSAVQILFLPHRTLRRQSFAVNRSYVSWQWLIRSFISRTARSSPTIRAREIMAWPIFSSCISGMAATACTLW